MAKQAETKSTSTESTTLDGILEALNGLQKENQQLRGMIDVLEAQLGALQSRQQPIRHVEDDPAKEIDRRRSVALKRLQDQRDSRNKGRYVWEFKILKHKYPLVHYLDTDDEMTARSLIERRIGTRWDAKKMSLKFMGTKDDIESAQKGEQTAA